jgi:hypothetical protein
MLLDSESTCFGSQKKIPINGTEAIQAIQEILEAYFKGTLYL